MDNNKIFIYSLQQNDEEADHDPNDGNYTVNPK